MSDDTNLSNPPLEEAGSDTAIGADIKNPPLEDDAPVADSEPTSVVAEHESIVNPPLDDDTQAGHEEEVLENPPLE